MEKSVTNYDSSTLASGLQVMEFVALVGQKKGVTLQNVTQTLGMHRSNAYRYLRTLVNAGWLEYDTDTCRYRLGPKPIQIAGASLQQSDLRTIARPLIEELSQKTCLAVHLGVLTESSIVYLDKVESNSPIQMRSRIGMTAPLYCTAMGKAILAKASSLRVRALVGSNMHARTPNTLCSLEALLDNLRLVRERGYALDLEENEPGIGCLAAAIYDFEDIPAGAISISTLIPNLTPETIHLLADSVMETARLISQNLGCHHNHWSYELDQPYIQGERKV